MWMGDASSELEAAVVLLDPVNARTIKSYPR